MKLYNSEGKAVTAYKTKRPRFSRRRQWDFDRHSINGQSVEFHLDRGYGHNYYFQFAGEWYRLNFSNIEQGIHIPEREAWTLSPPAKSVA